MSEYVSGAISVRDNKLYFGKLNSHSGIERGWRLKPGSYREFEWTGETPDSLTVRVETGELDSRYISAILAQYPTRSAMLESIHELRWDDVTAEYRDGKIILPDNLTVGGVLDLRGTGITVLPEGLRKRISGEICR